MDGDFPVSAVLIIASVHDSQVAIPLAQLSEQFVTSLYDLIDSAYNAPQFHAFSRSLGHVPIIDPHPRGGDKLPLAPAQGGAVQGTQRGGAGQQPLEGALRRALDAGARGGQGDVLSEVRTGGFDGKSLVCAAVLKVVKTTASGWRP